jgi:Cu-processing system permease protein
MMNIIILLIPLISLMFSLMYFYQVLEYIELLLSMPLSRRSVWAGYWAGACLALSLSFLFGAGLPVLFFGISFSWKAWGIQLLLGVLLTIIFVSISGWLAIRFENRLKGFGAALFIWLFLAVIYDGLFLAALLIFSDFPLENFAIAAILLNPIDMARVLMIFQLDFSALMGYTGAVFEKFFSKSTGSLLIILVYISWFFLILILMNRRIRKKDF